MVDIRLSLVNRSVTNCAYAGDMPPTPGDQLDALLEAAGLRSLQIGQNKQLIDYFELIQRWNTRTNLTSVRSPDAILQRHIVESIAAAQALPPGITTLLDYGSGAGFPGIPIAICRPEIAVTLAESQNKKAAFLQEAIRTTGIAARVHSGRAETLTIRYHCVTLRAVEHMDEALPAAALLVADQGWLAPLTTLADLPKIQAAVGARFTWNAPIVLPGSEQRILALGHSV
jgi:16S rRNA (guanine527-N7)-methyltransferase